MTVRFERTDCFGLICGEPIVLKPGHNYRTQPQTNLRQGCIIEVSPNPTGKKDDDKIAVRRFFGKEIGEAWTLSGNSINNFDQGIFDRAKNGFRLSSS